MTTKQQPPPCRSVSEVRGLRHPHLRAVRLACGICQTHAQIAASSFKIVFLFIAVTKWQHAYYISSDLSYCTWTQAHALRHSSVRHRDRQCRCPLGVVA